MTYRKRTIDMRLMAQHKYGMQIKDLPLSQDYFLKLGVASVTIELLQNKPLKATKITLNDLQTSTKGILIAFNFVLK